MIDKSSNLNFHLTFLPEIAHLSSLLRIADKYGELTKEEIFEITNIPTGERSGKVVPHIRYAEFMGLIDAHFDKSKFLLHKTELGETISSEDPYFIEPITQWLCHSRLTAKFGGAALWSFIFREYLPQHGYRAKETEIEEASKKFFGKQNLNVNPVRNAYCNNISFGKLGLITLDNDMWHMNSHSVQTNFKFLYGYILLWEWENCLPDRSEITLSEITALLGWNTPFGWTEKSALDALDILTDLQIVTLNRQLNPVTIVRNSNSRDLMPLLYSLLI